ncbi:MAG: DedA family protein [Proteobacteria bacterium]|nr:DedA family protein [Pseudomonadota bacterium]
MEAYVGLFVSGFLAATLLPLSSEVVLVALLAAGGNDIALLWFTASLGNSLGSALNWALGRYCLRWRERRWFPIGGPALDRATRWFRRFGVWSLVMAWLPVVGDPLTFVAGVMRVNFWLFFVLVAAGKGARYLAVILAARDLAG